jgi:cytochrome P450
MRHSLEPLLGDGLFVSDGDTWRKRRRMVAPIVHVSQLSRFAPVMVEAADEVRARWAKSDGVMIDALSESAWLTAEVICRSLFGRKLGHDYAKQIVDGFSEYQRLIGQIDLISLLGLPDWVPRWHRPALRRAMRRIHDVLDNVIESYRSKKDTDEDSVIQRLLDARDPDTGAPLDIKAIRNEIAVLFMAGHETTANSMAWTWLLLSQAPDAEARLHHELDTVLGGRLPTLADVPNLPYTRAVFEEAMRLSCRARRCRMSISAPPRFRAARSCWWCRGCCTAIRNTGRSRTTSCRSASCRRIPTAFPSSSTSRSASGRESAPACRSG